MKRKKSIKISNEPNSNENKKVIDFIRLLDIINKMFILLLLCSSHASRNKLWFFFC